MWTMIADIVVAAAGYIYVVLEGRQDDLKDALKLYASKFGLDKVKDGLAESERHNVDSLKGLLTKIGIKTE